jgi:predicted Zn-dependent protease
VPKYKDYGRVFRKTIQRFETLKDPKKINVKPDRIEIEKVRRAGTISDILKRRDIPEDRIEEIALLNGMQPEDRVPARSLIKVVKEGRKR